MRLRYGRGAYPVALHAPAGSWQAAGQRFTVLTRPPTIPISAYQRLVTVPIGNDGIAVPATFSAAGTAVCVVGPSGVGASWTPAQANAYTSLGQSDPSTVSVFAGPAAIAQYEVVASQLGGGAQVALGGAILVPGWLVWAIWSGGTPGATANLYVSGTKTVLVT